MAVIYMTHPVHGAKVATMELEAIAADDELYPDEAIEAIAKRLGFGDQFLDLYENGE